MRVRSIARILTTNRPEAATSQRALSIAVLTLTAALPGGLPHEDAQAQRGEVTHPGPASGTWQT